jgi:hypothetical protein
VAIAALAGTFWLTVATLRLVLHPPVGRASPAVAMPVPTAAPPSARIEALPPVRTCPERIPFAEQARRAATYDADSQSGFSRAVADMRPQLCACHQAHPARGKALVKLVVAKGGRVSSAVVIGPFAGTPLGACVAAAAKTVLFPRVRASTRTEFFYVMQ